MYQVWHTPISHSMPRYGNPCPGHQEWGWRHDWEDTFATAFIAQILSSSGHQLGGLGRMPVPSTSWLSQRTAPVIDTFLGIDFRNVLGDALCDERGLACRVSRVTPWPS